MKSRLVKVQCASLNWSITYLNIFDAGGHHAALEVQLLGYNGQLYSHHTTAARSPNGVVGIAILVKIGRETNLELERIIKAASKLKYAGNKNKTQILIHFWRMKFRIHELRNFDNHDLVEPYLLDPKHQSIYHLWGQPHPTRLSGVSHVDCSK